MNVEETIKIMLKGVAEHTSIEEIKEKLDKVAKEGRPLRIKLGLDPSAPDIHLGHAVVLRKIKQLQDLGHQAIIIIGDYTGMIGDPTGKSKTRKALSQEEVMVNAKTYQDQIFKVIDKDKTVVRFNSEWLSKLTFVDVISLASKCSVARMLERDDFNNRYKNHTPISVHEFFYPLMQAYDSVAIEADVELGGTDQTFNVLMGRNIQKDYGQDPQITLFMPLLEGVDGVEKMSKSLGNYIGINEDASVMYEKAMKIPDSMIIKYYELCTDVHPDEVDKIKDRIANGENPKNIKMELAKEIAKLYHGEEEAKRAEEHFKSAFQNNVVPEDAQTINVRVDDRGVGEALVDGILNIGKYKSKAEIRRLFAQNGVTINNEKVTDPKSIEKLTNSDVIQVGKGNFYRLNVE